MYVIGTAGHVDHGKSALVRALTGIEPDRLREEKERGLTIDLGFAWLILPGGEEVSIVDVPGHERFIKNMLAGVGGIDLALLVVAADEGVMPQTREHLAIIDLLGIARGVVALTKADLVDADFLELAAVDVEDALRGTVLEASPIVVCSSITGQGLDDLRNAIEAALQSIPTKRDIGRPRLPIDRAFTVAGFGTIVTGTLLDGSLHLGQEVEVLPARRRSRIRGLQAHGRKVETAPPGRRTAINLPGVAVDQLERGMVVALPGSLSSTEAVDVRLRAVRYLTHPIRHNLTVTFHTGSAEVEGRLLLLDKDELSPGEAAWGQVRLDAPVTAAKGDRFIIRDPNDTLAGGTIVDTNVRRHRRLHAPTLAALEILARGSPGDMVRIAIERLGQPELRELIRNVELDREATRRAVESLVVKGEIIVLDGATLPSETSLLCGRTGFESFAERVQEELTDYHRRFPLRQGMSREELRVRTGWPSRPFDQAVALLTKQATVRNTGKAVALAGYQPQPTPEQTARIGAYLTSLRNQPFAPPTDNRPEEELLSYLQDRGEIVAVTEGIAFSAEAYREMTQRIVDHLRREGTITLGQVRDMFGASRKYAQALLEHLDDQRVTRRAGDERVLR